MTPTAGEPRDLESLLARVARVRALARAVCTDGAGAEDLAQDALVVALERPGSEVAPLAWFRRVLERLALDRGRSEAARRGRERRVARGEVQPSMLDLVARADLQRRLVEEVLALPEPYREALLERWFEERAPAEIARRLGIPASTVRTRLARGHALLRERLERREGRGWMAALASLGGGREGAPAAATTIGTGGLLVATGTKIALVSVALALGALWFAWPGHPAATRIPARPEEVSVLPEAEVSRESGNEAHARAEVAMAEPELDSPALEARIELEDLSEPEAAALELEGGIVEDGALRGLVVRGRTPIASGTAWLCRGVRKAPSDPREPWPGIWGELPESPEEQPRSAPIGADGRFRFDGVAEEDHTLAIDAGEGVERQMTFDAGRGKPHATAIVVVLGSASIAGHVYDDLGTPVEGALVTTFQNMQRNGRSRAFTGSAVTDHTGAYRLRSLPAGTWPVLLYRDGAGSDPDEFATSKVELGERARLDFGRPRPLPVWSGVLRARSGEAVHGTTLRLVEVANSWRRDVPVEDGTFRIPLAPGSYRATVPATSRMLERIELAIVELGELDLARDLELPGTRLNGLALDATTGEAWSRDIEQSLSIRPRGQSGSAANTTRPVHSDGSFAFDGLWPGEWVLSGYPSHASALGGGEAVITVGEGDVEIALTVELALPR
ncbi:MAG TPA: sigma-70 family RNA polymerase sigma factor [Planctomycetota bacterium]|nr:sigma-70 family RNA polymerase sigma factor [Planctomycetota bacterium]